MAELSDAAAKLDALKWRCIGPPRGGRVVAVAGDPQDRNVFYFGACAGGVWKTTDGGTYWRCVSDGCLGSASIGALAVAPSDPNVIYAGTGETEIRLDVSYGDGVYKSTDAGRTWRHLGLRESRFVGRIGIHPQNPDLVYVAALGDVFGTNEERGVFRSADGGTTWRKVLYRDANSGAVDLSIDPHNPRILFAAFWQARRNFWNLSSGGPGSGLFRSTDGGESWTEVSRYPGLPAGPLGKIGVAVSPARAGRVWALVETEAEKTGLYRSEDYGENWTLVSSNRDLMHRPWYYTHVFADPRHSETVYVANFQLWKSTDGGRGFTEIQTPHGDNHDLWIVPAPGRAALLPSTPTIRTLSFAARSARAPAAPGRCSATITAPDRSSWSMSGPRNRPASHPRTCDTVSPGRSRSSSHRTNAAPFTRPETTCSAAVTRA
jgi:photosystem II stability/assembly factor-like uncharacterized protein